MFKLGGSVVDGDRKGFVTRVTPTGVEFNTAKDGSGRAWRVTSAVARSLYARQNEEAATTSAVDEPVTEAVGETVEGEQRSATDTAQAIIDALNEEASTPV